jgi:hypothetical protein
LFEAKLGKKQGLILKIPNTPKKKKGGGAGL